MKWFELYSSNTLAGSGNQYYFQIADREVHRGRIYYKIFAGGTYNYSLLFSNIIDSTYADGKIWSLEEIQADLLIIITKLKEAGVKVLIQTLPPFNWQDSQLEKWHLVNSYIREELSMYADMIFDIVPFLIDGPQKCGKARYGGHPNEEGCMKWAMALTPVVEEFLKLETK